MTVGVVLRLRTPAGPEETSSPSIDDVLAAAGRLDGVRTTELSLADEETAGIHVVGGPDRYSCWVQRWNTEDELVIATAVDPTASAGAVSFTLGNGQVDRVERKQTIDASALERIFRAYLEDRGLEPSVAWEHDPGSW